MRKFKKLSKSFFVAIGVLSSIVTILWSIFSEKLGNVAKEYPYYLLITIGLISIIYTLYENRSRSKIRINLSDKVKASIFFGNVFDAKDIIVIPVNEYFDTIVDDKIISSKTIHGIFVKTFFGGNESELKRQIKNGLSNYSPIRINDNRTSGNKNAYPLGTVCEVKKDDKIFYLFALTRFNDNNRAEIKNSEYQRVLCDLFYFIEQNSQGRKVTIPLIGAGHSGVNLSKQKLLEFLILSIAIIDGLTLINGIDIILHESVKDDIDLSSIEILFNNIGN